MTLREIQAIGGGHQQGDRRGIGIKEHLVDGQQRAAA
jgi:hypothetical protein